MNDERNHGMDTPLYIFRADASVGARLLCAYLWGFARPGKERAWPSNETICSDLGISRRTAQRLIKECTEKGLFLVGETPEGPCGFHLNVENGATDLTRGATDLTQPATDLTREALLKELKIELEDVVQKDPDSEKPKPKKKPKKRREQTDEAWDAYIGKPYRDDPSLLAHLKARFPAYDGLNGRLAFDEVIGDAKRWWMGAPSGKAWIDPAGLIKWFSRDYNRVRWGFEKDNAGTGNTVVPTLRPDRTVSRDPLRESLFDESERVDKDFRDQYLSVVRGSK